MKDTRYSTNKINRRLEFGFYNNNRSVNHTKMLSFVFVFLLNVCFVSGQIVTQFKPANPFHFTPEQSWEMDIINMFESSLRVKASATIYIEGNATPITEMTSEVLMLNRGHNSFNAMTTQTESIRFFDPDIGTYVQSVGKYPAGKYRICVRLQCVTPDCDGLSANALLSESLQCREVIVELPTPLILTTPFDKSELENTRPVFTWIPPMPVGGILELRYLYTLVEKREGQSKIDAIKRNRPIIRDEFVERPTLMYPLDVDELEYEKDYVWQVEAWYGNLFIATSEVWEFKIVLDSIIEIVNFSQSFIELGKQDGSILYGAVGELKFRHDSRKENASLKCTILDDKEQKTGQPLVFTLRQGDNRFVVDFKNHDGIKHEKTYLLFFEDEKKNIFKVRIKYIEPEESEEAEVIKKRKSEIQNEQKEKE